MKKIIKLLSVLLSVIFVLSACTSKAPENTSAQAPQNETVKIVVGATPVPHAEILNLVKPTLKEKGIELDIKEVNEYAVLNPSLNDKQLDANFFQHIPYLDDFNKQRGAKLVPVVKVHVEPMGAYSSKIKSIDEIKDGDIIAIPNDATNEGRALLLLQSQGLIKLKEEKGLTQTPRDIIDNPKNLKFKELEAPQLPRVLQDVDLAIINTNFALKGHLNPAKDAIFMEGKDSQYVNVLVAREDNQNSTAIQELSKALNSEEVKKYLAEKYNGSIVPAF